jgi:hypothetical protein
VEAPHGTAVECLASAICSSAAGTGVERVGRFLHSYPSAGVAGANLAP